MNDDELTDDYMAREWRGIVYQARQRVRRLEGAYPVGQRNEHNERAIRQARQFAATAIVQARAEGVRILAARGRRYV